MLHICKFLGHFIFKNWDNTEKRDSSRHKHSDKEFFVLRFYAFCGKFVKNLTIFVIVGFFLQRNLHNSIFFIIFAAKSIIYSNIAIA